ncbi:hypothetical protein CQW23_12263 [Capsicum baccatum]|uniref:CCR4-NOT transcription complex subunit 11 n=1 Tax=Capsicum baccatum TaxID=33114 RepID=A0A2G2WS37_CAPBA|nr:hypothetical protein CQW23_12263 [Capsicum baccatum]
MPQDPWRALLNQVLGPTRDNKSSPSLDLPLSFGVRGRKGVAKDRTRKRRVECVRVREKMLGKEESNTLLTLLKAGDHRPFDEIVADFISSFRPHRQFYACISLALILDEKLLEPAQRLVAFAILQQVYSPQVPSSNPFISLLVNAACDEGAEQRERAFILQLLGSASSTSSREVLKQSATDHMKMFDTSQLSFPQREQLQQQYGNKALPEQFQCLFRNNSVKNSIPDRDVPRGCDSNSLEFDLLPGSKPKIGSGDVDETITGLLSNLSLEGLGPQWIRPHPPRLPVLDGELVWLNPDYNYELLWDHGMCADTSRGAAVRDLIAKALKGPLVPAQQEDIEGNGSEYAYRVNMTHNLEWISETNQAIEKPCGPGALSPEHALIPFRISCDSNGVIKNVLPPSSIMG